jgi:hypothetical protein
MAHSTFTADNIQKFREETRCLTMRILMRTVVAESQRTCVFVVSIRAGVEQTASNEVFLFASGFMPSLRLSMRRAL